MISACLLRKRKTILQKPPSAKKNSRSTIKETWNNNFFFGCFWDLNVSEDLSKLEDNREGVGNLYCTVSLLSGFPLRGARNDANSFLVKGVINATEDLDIGYTAVCLYSKLKGDTALNTIFLCNLRIDKLGVDPLRELVGISAVELRFFLYELEWNSFLLYFLFLNFFFLVVHDFYTCAGIILKGLEHVINFDVIVDDVDLVRQNRDVRCLGRRRRGLLLNGDHLLDVGHLGGLWNS